MAEGRKTLLGILGTSPGSQRTKRLTRDEPNLPQLIRETLDSLNWKVISQTAHVFQGKLPSIIGIRMKFSIEIEDDNRTMTFRSYVRSLVRAYDFNLTEENSYIFFHALEKKVGPMTEIR